MWVRRGSTNLMAGKVVFLCGLLSPIRVVDLMAFAQALSWRPDVICRLSLKFLYRFCELISARHRLPNSFIPVYFLQSETIYRALFRYGMNSTPLLSIYFLYHEQVLLLHIVCGVDAGRHSEMEREHPKLAGKILMLDESPGCHWLRALGE
ncbi:hypothetical protein TNCV_1976061 [Trichonephila clavipes]|nr:hypothetical protein TNCV_1976061 [Trichonephila clavipes]